MLLAGGADFIQTERDGWKTYRNEKFGYEMSYPPEMRYKEYVNGSSGDLKDARSGTTLISFEVWPPGQCPTQPKDTTAKAIGIERAKTVTQADGPDSSFYCGDPVKVREFASSHGAAIFELELTCMREVFQELDGGADSPASRSAEENSSITIEGKKGPTYFADISQAWRKRILLADPFMSNPLSTGTAKDGMDPAVIRKILDTLRTFPIPRPPGICIEDLH